MILKYKLLPRNKSWQNGHSDPPYELFKKKQKLLQLSKYSVHVELEFSHHSESNTAQVGYTYIRVHNIHLFISFIPNFSP